jgi:O-acetylserine/cysteine efflux transporter
MNNLTKFLGLGFLCLIWGLNWIAIKISLEGLPPFISAGCRFLIAVVILFFYIKIKGISLKINTRQFWLLLATGFMTYAMDYGLIYWGEQYLSAGVTSIFFSTFALFTALFSNFIFKNEPFRWHKYFGILVGFVGILVIFFDQLLITRFSLKVILASGAIILGAASAALSTVIVKKYLTQMGTVALSFYQMVMGTCFLVILAGAAEDFNQVQLSTPILLTVIYMGLMASAAAFVIYYALLKHMSAISLSLMIYVIPMVALVGDYFFYKQVPSLRSFIGMAFIFSGIWLSQGRRKKKVEGRKVGS